MTYPELNGRVVLITGTNNAEGIGQAMIREFAAQGSRLLLTYRPVPPGARPQTDPPEPGDVRYAWLNAGAPLDLVQRLRADGVEVEARPFDHAVPDSAEAVIDWALSSFGTIDVIVSNAAACEPDSFAEGATPLTAQSCDHHYAVNVRFPALLLHCFARMRRDLGRKGGGFIAISSNASHAHAGAVSYAASKHAFESYVRAAAWELGPDGVRVNTISPGPVQTGYIDDGMQEDLLPWIPLRRLGRSEDIAQAAAFLASDQARWITGETLHVTGGHSMR
jgi:3-oxoacyl-[acyl-carrier protein] reductase